MKIIFLDIDWVLIKIWNSKEIRKSRAEKGKWWLLTEFDPKLVLNLKQIIKETDAKIVLSSSWRHHMELARNSFYEANLDWNLVMSKTPHTLWYWRGNEILTWIQDYHKTCRNWYHITNWIAIDDEKSDMKAISRLWKLIHTKWYEWLTINKMKEAIDKLNKQN
jgi:hypothetical protein